MQPTVSQFCQELIAQLSGFLDGELDAALCQAIERHLATCRYCRVVVDTTEKTLLLYRDAPAEAVPRDVHAHLIKALGLESHANPTPPSHLLHTTVLH
jgi:anti-sigma factor RsiW